MKIKMKKKKFYLYLGLFGIALILGSFGIIINNSISGTYAVNTETCVDSTSVCADGYSKVVLNGVTQCRKVTNVSKDSDCDGTVKTSYSCSISGYDLIEYGGKTYCGKEVSASTENACNEDWIDGKCYKLINPTTTKVCYVYDDISYSCDAGYTLSSDKQSCCWSKTTDYSDCDDASASDKATCRTCIDNGGSWNGEECQGAVTLKNCSQISSASTQKLCSACVNNGLGSWDFDANTCECNSGYEFNSYTRTCAVKGYVLSTCTEYFSESLKTKCQACTGEGKEWDFSEGKCTCSDGYVYNSETESCEKENIDEEENYCTSNEDCKTGLFCYANECLTPSTITSCNVLYSYKKDSSKLEMCTSCRDSNGTWDFASSSCSCQTSFALNEEGSCVRNCRANADCDSDSMCNTNNQCVKDAECIYNSSCKDGYYCNNYKCVEGTTATECSAFYEFGSILTKGYSADCTSCREDSDIIGGFWDFKTNKCIICELEDGKHYNKYNGECTSDYAQCNYESSDQNAVCTTCLDGGNTWENDTCNTGSQKECSVKFNKCTNSNVKNMCEKDYGGRLSDDNTCIYETSGTCASSTYTCSSTTKTITNSTKNECTSLYCNLCVTTGGEYIVRTSGCNCGTGKTYDNVKGCVEVESGSSSSASNTTDSTSTKSGYYYLKNGICTEYPYLPGYCVEPGQLFYRSELSGYTESNTATLSCVEVAAGYYAGGIPSAAFFAAQELMNSREYYLDSECKTRVTSEAFASTIESKAQKWCNTIPSFSGETIYLKTGESKTLTDSTNSLSDYSISGGSSILSISTNSNIITVKAIGSSGCNTITMSKGSVDSYKVYENPNSQNYATIEALPLVKASFEVCITSEDEPVTDTYGGLKIVKNDADGNVLSGVKFKMGTNLYGTEGTDWSYKVTDSNGEIKVENIKTGTTYYYQEVSTIDGYVLDSNIYNVSIKKDEVISINVVNYKEGNATFKILKTDEGNKPLSGIKFKIGTNLAGTEGTDWSYIITDESGVITVGDIPINTTYYYQEVSTLDGYILNDEVKKVILDEENIVVIKGEVNYTNTSVTIIKKDADNGTLLKNVKFDIYDEDGNVVYSKMTDKNGEIIIQGINNGKYYALEKEAADGYLLDNVKHSFEISDDNKHVVIEVTNKVNNPQTGSFYIYTMLIVGSACLCISILQYKRIRNEDTKL